ncbi:response regulator [Halorhabdus amylolytica]|uniref:response regulator n=1 Tax=Halorhabdus amylolytica TaxID=2559573 RepID=UPI001B7D907B|nr:response regulator [Halorhabdus amylolytica]
MDTDVDRPSRDCDRLRVLVVDDDLALAEVASTFLERRLERVDAVPVSAPGDALERVEGDPSIDCVISDYRMPGIDGLELYDRVTERRPDLPFILFTASPTEDLEREACEAGVAAFVEKDGSTRTFAALSSRVRREAT